MITAIRTQTNALQLFITLQCLDALTTLLFLSRGVEEGNPLVSWALSSTHTPWMGLVVTKMTAALIAQYCYKNQRFTPLRWANIGYSVVVGWNLIAIAATALAR